MVNKLIARRIIEIFLSSILCSAPLMGLLVSGIVRGTIPILFFALFGSFVLFFLANAFFINNTYLQLDNERKYYKVNFISYSVYAVISMVLCFIVTINPTETHTVLSSNSYTGIFMPTRILQTINYVNGSLYDMSPPGTSTAFELLKLFAGLKLERPLFFTMRFSTFWVNILMYALIFAVKYFNLLIMKHMEKPEKPSLRSRMIKRRIEKKESRLSTRSAGKNSDTDFNNFTNVHFGDANEDYTADADSENAEQ